MPIIKSAIKRAKQTVKRRERNIGIKKDIKTAVKKGLLKKNTVARRKSALSKIAKNAGVKLEAAK